MKKDLRVVAVRVAAVVAVVVIVQVSLLAVYRYVKSHREGDSIAVAHLSRPAPELTLRTHDGSSVLLSDLRGSTVVLHFWATWCPPCRDELPALLKFAASSGVRLLAVSVDPEWDAVRGFVGDESLEAVYLASSEAVSAAFGVDELPQTFVIDASGMLTLHLRGAQRWHSRKVQALIMNGIRANSRGDLPR